MLHPFSATVERRSYNRWVANETMEDFALRYTARRARRWTNARVANTALGSISFLALEAIGGAITLTYGFTPAIIAIMLAGLLLFLTGLPISYYAARYGVDIDLLTRGAGFGYIGSTLTSLIYASFTFIFFALEAAILSYALEFCFGIPLFIGYLISALVVIPLVMNGFSKISAFQAWTQPFWIVLHLLPFVLLGFTDIDLTIWTSFEGLAVTGDVPAQATVAMVGAASGMALSLIAQIGEQVDFLRFLPEPKTPAERRRWWFALLSAGPGWSILGVVKMIAGSFLVTLAVAASVPVRDATDPTRMYHTAFETVVANPTLALLLTGAFVILSQLKINVTNAYAGSIAWSNFFSRLTHSHPGRVVWLLFNVAIALLLMELGVFHALEMILGLYSHVALGWIGALTADLVVNKPLKLSPKGIEFRRAHLYDVNPVGTGAMAVAVVASLIAYSGALGSYAHSYSAILALVIAFVTAPVIAFATGGKYYIARKVPDLTPDPVPHIHGKPRHNDALCTCTLCNYRFDTEDMTHCPFYAGPICSLCCTLDASCRDACKPEARIVPMLMRTIRRILPKRAAEAMMSRMAVFMIGTLLPASMFGGLLLLIRSRAASPDFDAVLTVIFSSMLVVIGIIVWTLILSIESQHKARDEADLQAQRLLREIRAHERTDKALQAAKEKAEAANLAKTRYMAGLSHELRTPLNAIYGFAQILENASDVPRGRLEAVRAIRRGSEHLAGLIENLLDISKIEAGRLELNRNRIHLPTLLNQVGAIFEGQAREKGLQFGIRTTGHLPDWVDFDEKRLRQIIINLLSNAIRYTDTGSVTLHVTYRNEVARIEVSDTGYGIAPEAIDRIWSPFERLSQKSGGGSGLGLTITKLLVEILGGEIKVESTPGEGSSFFVRFMLPSVTEATGAPLTGTPERGAKPLPVSYAGARRTLLVVDDDLDHLKLMEAVLKPLGFLVQMAHNAETALDIVDDLRPDLFLLDIDMPGMDGWELAQSLRSDPELRSIPIMMVSGHALEARQPVEREGLYDAFVIKPFSVPEVITRIGALLKLEYVMGENTPAPDPIRPLPDDVHMRLRDLAGIGHAAGLQRELDALERDGIGSPEMIALLHGRLRDFDMQGILRLLREMDTHAA
ncbi:MAG: ATP-binding protein [Pseudomonadota bacterium]|nr:ATP-binding protein [Pseudomonadota bacterium]